VSLGSAINISSQSLENISSGFALISQNIANASTPGYSREMAPTVSLDAGGQGIGAKLAPSSLATNAALQMQLYSQNAASSAATTTNTALSALQPVLGTVGQGNDLGSLLANLQSAFSTLLNDPSSQTQQVSVVSAAQSVAQQINALSNAYGQARQSAQNTLVTQVVALNTALAQVGSLSNQIIALKAQNAGTADLENQRNQALTTISGLVSAHFVEQPDGGMEVFTAGGAQLPTLGGTPLSISAATTGAAAYYPGGGLPGIVMNGADITAALTGGSIGANVVLRDQTLPTYQGELDEFSQTLTTRFAAQGLALFSDPQGNVPAGGGTPTQSTYIGYSSVITVNPTVAATPADVRDGTAGQSGFAPNPNNLAGYTDLIDRVLNFALGANQQANVAQPSPATTGLGAGGTLSAPFAAPATLADFATDITASQSSDSATAATSATDAASVQTSLAGSLNTQTGVDVDSQLSLMVQLQNAYGANGKIISSIEDMFNTLLSDITPAVT
jgi:flagellar hook-associated protein 1 FlgK